jgi:hypothetical protein
MQPPRAEARLTQWFASETITRPHRRGEGEALVREIIPGLALSIAFASLAVTAPARACGGFFCSSQPMSQAGEDILYDVETDGSLTMMVRIVYSGEADDFAWILPLPTAPDRIDVGPEAVFEQLASATQPVFRTDARVEGACRPVHCTFPGSGCCHASPTVPACGAGIVCSGDAGPIASDAGGVHVLSEETVGPYESVVLEGGTSGEIETWLVDHGYDVPAATPNVLADYVASGHVFLALRLLASASTAAIQPIVLHIVGTAPCLPIRMTALATVPDLPIAAYFLAPSPVVPTNYSLLAPTLEATLWQGQSWTSHVTRAVDAAGGHAFVMDHAAAPPPLALTLPSVRDLAAESDPRTFFLGVRLAGYPADAQVLAIIDRFLDPPAGTDVRSYVDSCIRTSCARPASFDPAGLVDALEAEVRSPRQDWQDRIARAGVVTRLFTTMSADEMTLDPEFRIDSGIELVSNVHVATAVGQCSGDWYEGREPQQLELPDGRRVPLSDGFPVASDEAYCRSLGGHATSSTCASSRSTRGAGAAFAVLAATSLALRRRRTLRATSDQKGGVT